MTMSKVMGLADEAKHRYGPKKRNLPQWPTIIGFKLSRIFNYQVLSFSDERGTDDTALQLIARELSQRNQW